MKWENIPPKVRLVPIQAAPAFLTIAVQLVINFDQTGTYILPGNSFTYEKSGVKQVDMVAKDEKQAYTLLVASTAAGDFLPFQQVWAGSTDHSLPKSNAPKMGEARELGFNFAFAKSPKKTSHFSTLKTMIEVRELKFKIPNNVY